jgi:repressor LexA
MALSERQERILAFVRSYIEKHAYPPSFREIGRATNISSTSVVKYNLERLQDRGYIERTGDISRAIRLTEPASSLAFTLRVPLLGTIAAGDPIPVPETVSEAEVDLQDTIELTRDIVKDEEGIYALRVQGDSMIDAFINDGDLVLMKHQLRVENGELAAVWVHSREETTLKRFYLEGAKVRLQPENPELQPMYFPAQDVEVQGKVIAVIRNLN